MLTKSKIRLLFKFIFDEKLQKKHEGMDALPDAINGDKDSASYVLWSMLHKDDNKNPFRLDVDWMIAPDIEETDNDAIKAMDKAADFVDYSGGDTTFLIKKLGLDGDEEDDLVQIKKKDEKKFLFWLDILNADYSDPPYYRDEIDGIMDARSYAKDPYAYYGVSRSDF